MPTLPPTGSCVTGHSAFIYDRGGTRRLGPLVEMSSVRWERNRDGVSEAQVIIEGSACHDQAPFLEMIRSHRHELVIYRGNDRVWEGPVHRVAWYRDYVEVTAKDVIEYLMFTPLSRLWSNGFPNTGPVSTRIGKIIEYELTTNRQQYENGILKTVTAWENLTHPINVLPYLQIHHFVNEVETSAVTLPYEMTVGEHMANLAHYSGIDYTAVGRAIHVWDVSRALGRTVQLTDENFLDEIIVTEYGADHAQSAYVIGNDGVYGSALKTQNLDYYGPWTKVFTAYNEEGTTEPTQGELNSQAIRNLAGATPAPVEVRVPDNSGLILSDHIRITDLVPGVQVPLRATLNARQYSQMQKIDHVVVTETASEGERIQITLVPTTRPDADDELPEPEDTVSALFPGDPNYRLTAIASTSGNTVLLRARVTKEGGSGRAASNQPWSIMLETATGTNKTKSGTWDFKFQFYKEKVAGTAEFPNVGSGTRPFSVTVNMGPGVGEATVSGTVFVYG